MGGGGGGSGDWGDGHCLGGRFFPGREERHGREKGGEEFNNSIMSVYEGKWRMLYDVWVWAI